MAAAIQVPIRHVVPVVVCGMGAVGRTLVNQVLDNRKFHADRFGIRFEIVAALDSSGAVMSKELAGKLKPLKGFSDDLARQLVKAKSDGFKLKDHDLGMPITSLKFVQEYLEAGSILMDCSAAETAPVVVAAIERGAGVALANKKPLTDSLASWKILSSAANLPRLKYESTVGAGTPMVACLHRLLNAGDQVSHVQGTFSGTLGYLMSGLEKGTPYSQVVKTAYDLGYTEPEPRDDLGGTDVARKALILARTMGLELEMSDVVPEPLFPAALKDLPVPEFLANLAGLDVEYNAKVKQAMSEEKVLRYVASINEGKCEVGLRAVPKDSPLGRLQGTANMVAFHTKTYGDDPLVVQGAGAGGEVTAAGVLADMVELALTMRQ